MPWVKTLRSEKALLRPLLRIKPSLDFPLLFKFFFFYKIKISMFVLGIKAIGRGSYGKGEKGYSEPCIIHSGTIKTGSDPTLHCLSNYEMIC